MKAKINFSGSGIKKFFVNNGEKLFLVLTALVLLAFLYSAITAKPLDDSKSPDAIKREAGQLVATLQTPTWTPRNDPPHFKQQADAIIRPISGQKLKPVHDWNPPLFPELVKRVDPEIYAVEELHIDAGRGIVPYHAAASANAAGAGPGMGPGMGPGHGPGPGGPGFGPGGPGFGPGGPGYGPGGPGFGPGSMGGPPMGAGGGRVDPNGSLPGVHAPGADTQGKTYVILTGAVPVEKEAEEFRRRFEYAVPAISTLATIQSDTPHYFCFLVDRCEVKDADDKTRNWTPILSKTNYVNSQAITDIAKWFTTGPEIVHLDDVFQPYQGTSKGAPFNAYLTWPLPPLFLKNWGFEAAHPKVKLNIAQEAAPETAPEGEQGQGAANLDNTTPEARSRFGGPNYGPGGGPGSLHGPGGPTMGPGGYGMGPGFAGNRLMGTNEQFVDPYRLFRFVDLTAEPGKTYRYRVQLLIINPNYGLQAMCLDPKAIEAGSDKKKYVESPWIESAAIKVPHEFQVLADGVNVPGGRLSELKARINLLAIAKTPAADSVTGGEGNKKDTYVEVVKDMEVPLGGIVYLHDTDIDKVLDMSAEAVRKVEKISVDTDQTVLLDVRNDKPLGDGRVKDATEILLMDGNGNVFDASRAADRFVLDDYQQRTKPPAEMKESTGESPLYHPGPGGGGPGHPGPVGPGKSTGKGPGSGPGKSAK